jgi:hypothetical protein
MTNKNTSDTIEAIGETRPSADEVSDGQTSTQRIRSHQPLTTERMSWRFLHPALWLLLLAIGGPIMLHQLANHYLDDVLLPSGQRQSPIPIYDPTLPCQVGHIWTSWSTLLQINIRTGNLSFAAAKIIDVAFDLVVGRGGQALLAWIAIRVYRHSDSDCRKWAGKT